MNRRSHSDKQPHASQPGMRRAVTMVLAATSFLLLSSFTTLHRSVPDGSIGDVANIDTAGPVRLLVWFTDGIEDRRVDFTRDGYDAALTHPLETGITRTYHRTGTDTVYTVQFPDATFTYGLEYDQGGCIRVETDRSVEISVTRMNTCTDGNRIRLTTESFKALGPGVSVTTTAQWTADFSRVRLTSDAAPLEVTEVQYNAHNDPLRITDSVRGKVTATKGFTYAYDSRGNWVRRVTTDLRTEKGHTRRTVTTDLRDILYW